jgi:hypothetical protein
MTRRGNRHELGADHIPLVGDLTPGHPGTSGHDGGAGNFQIQGVAKPAEATTGMRAKRDQMPTSRVPYVSGIRL